MCGVNSTFIGLILKLHIDFSEDISLVPLQGETSSKEEEQLWLGEKKIWISGTENIKENGETFVLDSFLKENRESLVLDDPPIEENKIELNSQRPERPTHFFLRKNILGERKISLLCLLIPLLMILPCHRMSLPGLTLRYVPILLNLLKFLIPILILIRIGDILFVKEKHLIDSFFRKPPMLSIRSLTLYPITVF